MFVAGKKRKLGSLGAPKAAAAAAAPTDTAGASPASAADRWYALGVENLRSKQYGNALDYLNRCVAAARNEGVRNAKAYEARALALHRLGEHARALDDAKSALRIDAHSAVAYAHMASALAATGRPRDALDVVDRGLRTADAQASGYAHLQAQRETLQRRLDPAYVPRERADCDPVARLAADVCVAVFALLDTRSLAACRGVSRRWQRLVDGTAVLWARPCFSPPTAVGALAQQLPAYAKLRRALRHLPGGGRVPDAALRTVLTRSREALRMLVIPEAAEPSARTLDALLACRRPVLEHIGVGRGARLTAPALGRVLSHCLAATVAAVHVPYNALVTDAHMALIARAAPQLRSLDISGCLGVRVRQLFRAWNATLGDARRVTRLERLHLCDHPGIPELLVYACKHRHFSGLRALHVAIRDQAVYARITGIAALTRYFEQIDAPHVPFPALSELNIDGLWDATTSAHRFESQHTADLLLRTRVVGAGLLRLSALDAGAVGTTPLLATLQRCFSTLRHLHVTRATGFSPDAVHALVHDTAHTQLRSLDLSGCVGLTAASLRALVQRSPLLELVNLGHTAADNAVLAVLAGFVDAPGAAGLQAVVLDSTDVTGAGARDFAAACERRFRGMRRAGGAAALSAWRLRLLDLDNCAAVGADAVAVVRDLLSAMGTRVTAAAPS
ncbi:hypothetical protein GGI15_004467 [Coemansia interrupta]|uniref:F-box domain-containing protein n=1 Tax=Coemansia interrupta TaxID=1126814 RepID=A0A9W8LEV1_9FUNG|nr:hypothetical protein GGI15_004467 [Coemansia interrupta]